MLTRGKVLIAFSVSGIHAGQASPDSTSHIARRKSASTSQNTAKYPGLALDSAFSVILVSGSSTPIYLPSNRHFLHGRPLIGLSKHTQIAASIDNSITIRRPSVPRGQHHRLGFLLASSLRYHGMATSTLLLLLGSPAKASSDAVLVLGAHDLCIRFSHGAREHLIETGYLRLPEPCAVTTAGTLTRVRLLLQAARGRVEV